MCFFLQTHYAMAKLHLVIMSKVATLPTCDIATTLLCGHKKTSRQHGDLDIYEAPVCGAAERCCVSNIYSTLTDLNGADKMYKPRQWYN